MEKDKDIIMMRDFMYKFKAKHFFLSITHLRMLILPIFKNIKKMILNDPDLISSFVLFSRAVECVIIVLMVTF